MGNREASSLVEQKTKQAQQTHRENPHHKVQQPDLSAPEQVSSAPTHSAAKQEGAI